MTEEYPDNYPSDACKELDEKDERIKELEAEIERQKEIVLRQTKLNTEVIGERDQANNRASLATSLSGDLLDDKQEKINNLEAQLADAMETRQDVMDANDLLIAENDRLREALMPVPVTMDLGQIEHWLQVYEEKREQALK